MLLFDILESIDFKIADEDLENTKNTNINKITIDSRTVGESSLFICIKGLTTDGHDFIDKAAQKGAVAAVCDRMPDIKPDGMIIILVDNSREALNSIAANFYGNPQEKLRLTGVTGTNGKTSITYFLQTIFEQDGRKCGVIGTSGAYAGGEAIDIAYATSTTPDTIELYAIFAEMGKKGVTDVLMEVSSHALALKKVDRLRFRNAIFTNLTQDHLDFHGTFENYLDSKAKLFKMSEYAVINADDSSGSVIAKAASGRVITYSIDMPSDFKAENIRFTKDGSAFSLRIFGNMYSFRLNIPGKFSLYNALAAIVTCLISGVSAMTAVHGVSEIKNVPGRIQSIPNNRGLGVFVDYAHTPDGLDNIIRAVKFFTSGRVITVFGCGGDRDTAKRPVMGRIAGELSDFCVITSDNPRSEKPEDIISEIENGIIDTGCEYIKETDRRKAIFKAIDLAREGDSVILAGKGHENYQEFENKRRIFFDDAVVAGEALHKIHSS